MAIAKKTNIYDIIQHSENISDANISKYVNKN